jgi:hypothetical protein
MTDVDIEYRDWHAIHDHMSKSLRVYGHCHIRGGGSFVELELRQTQGINQRMLMLDLRIVPTGESPAEQDVEYQQPWDADGIDYDEVGFVVAGDFTAPTPPNLAIEDVY